MKLVIAIVHKEDSGAICHALTKDGFFVTKLPTTGGFLLSGNVTLLCGVEDDKVEQVLGILRKEGRQRTEVVPSTASYGIGVSTAYPLEVTVGGATVFVVPVDRFEKL